MKSAVVAVILCLLAAQSTGTLSTVASIGRPSDQASFEPFTRCNDSGDAGDLMWDGSRIVSRSGIHYAIVEVTKLVYGGGIPSEIGLRAPISIERVTFSSPSLTLATLEDKPTTLHLQMNVACNDVKATN